MVSQDDPGLSIILKVLTEYGYTNLSSIDSLLERTDEARQAMSAESTYSLARGELARAIAFMHPDFREDRGWTDLKRALFNKYEHLVIK